MPLRTCFVTLLLTISLLTASLTAQIISGTATIKLHGPATKELSQKATLIAQDKLKRELLLWLSEEAKITLDTTNALQNYTFKAYFDSCMSIAKKESSIKGKSFTQSCILTADNAQNVLTTYNIVNDRMAVGAWQRLLDAQQSSDNQAIYREGVATLFFARTHIGSPVATPDSGGRVLADDAALIVQKFFDKMTVSSTGMILAGKTGQLVQDPPSVTIMIDSLPLAQVTLTGVLQSGTELFSITTDETGTASLNQFKIPFVPNGTLLYVTPNLGAVVASGSFISPKLLGINLNNSQTQSFIFKITRPTYSLNFTATSVSAITLPPDFASPLHVKKFLQDSCYLQEGTAAVDLAITVKSQVSSYTYDETEEIGIKVVSQITVEGLSLKPPKTTTREMTFEKRYERYTDIPYGLFFWEANGQLRTAIKQAIAGL